MTELTAMTMAAPALAQHWKTADDRSGRKANVLLSTSKNDGPDNIKRTPTAFAHQGSDRRRPGLFARTALLNTRGQGTIRAPQPASPRRWRSKEASTASLAAASAQIGRIVAHIWRRASVSNRRFTSTEPAAHREVRAPD